MMSKEHYWDATTMLQLEEALSDAVSQAAQHPVVGVAAVEAVASNLQAKVDGPAAHLIREAALTRAPGTCDAQYRSR